MRIIQKNAWVGLFLAVIGFGSFNLLGAISTDYEAALESNQPADAPQPTEFETMEWFAKALPYPVVVVESDEAREMSALAGEARNLLGSRDFAKLDAFFKKLRDSKEQFANGSWKLHCAYHGISLSEESSVLNWETHLAILQQWTNAQPQSVTARVALADAFVSYAWRARGNGPTGQISEVGSLLFNARMTEASRVLIQARSLKEKCPYMWFVLFRKELGISTGKKTFDANFKRAVAAWPDYTPFYQGRAYYFLPRWNGEIGEWESDLAKSADEVGGEDGDILYARAVWSMHQSRLFSNIFTDNNISWPRVNKGFEAIEKRFPASLQTQSEHAYLAALAEDSVTTHRYLALIQGKVDPAIWRTRETFLHCANWSFVQDDQAKVEMLIQPHVAELSQAQ
jgi:Domain of unknown function (DUF4034)